MLSPTGFSATPIPAMTLPVPFSVLKTREKTERKRFFVFGATEKQCEFTLVNTFAVQLIRVVTAGWYNHNVSLTL